MQAIVVSDNLESSLYFHLNSTIAEQSRFTTTVFLFRTIIIVATHLIVRGFQRNASRPNRADVADIDGAEANQLISSEFAIESHDSALRSSGVFGEGKRRLGFR